MTNTNTLTPDREYIEKARQQARLDIEEEIADIEESKLLMEALDDEQV